MFSCPSQMGRAGLCGQGTSSSRKQRVLTSLCDDFKKSSDVLCLHSTVVLSHSLSGMLVFHAFGGHHPTGVALSWSLLASHHKARCCFRRGVAGIVCSDKRPPIKLIATDVDGTLLNSKQELTPAVEQAIKKAADLGVPVIFCLSIDTYRQKGAS